MYCTVEGQDPMCFRPFKIALHVRQASKILMGKDTRLVEVVIASLYATTLDHVEEDSLASCVVAVADMNVC